MSTPSHSPGSGPIRWTTEPSPLRPLYVPILRPSIDRPLVGVFVSRTVLGCDLHHDGHNTVPCVGELNGCKPCVEGRAWRRYWFATVLQPGAGRLGVLSITDGAWRNCPPIQDQNNDLRGTQYRAFRTGRSVNGPMQLSLGRKLDATGLPPDIDLRAHLLRVWGWRYNNDQA